MAIPPAETIIGPPSPWLWLPLAELWAYRDLFRLLAWRDVQVRYKQTALGVGWAVIQPLALMGLFAAFIGRVAEVPTDGVPYSLFAFSGLLPWFLFATAVAAAANSLIDSERLVSKVYFPRLLIPAAATVVAVVDYLVASVVLLVLLAIDGRSPSWSVVLVAPTAGLIFLAAIGVGSFLAAWNVKYRDFRYALPFVIQCWMFATPTIYLSLEAAGTRLPEWLRTAARLNPLTGFVEFHRAAVLDLPLPWAELGFAAVVGAVWFVLGTAYFTRVEDGFADVI